MAHLINLQTFTDKRGNLTVVEDQVLPFKIKRLFYIYGVDDSPRGGHRHKKTFQALICLKGSCTIHNNDNKTKESFVLDSPSKCLILEPQDWHVLDHFTEDAILQVLASQHYDHNDYIFEDYPA